MTVLSTQHLRTVFKTNIDGLLKQAENAADVKSILPQIQEIGERMEKTIEQKVQMLEEDFHDYEFTGEYLRTITESFTDLEQLLRNSKMFSERLENREKPAILNQIKIHYTQVLVPLLNIMSKLENDYVSIATNCIFQKQESITQVQANLHKLKLIKRRLENSIFVLGRKRKISAVQEEINNTDLERKFLQLTLHHDRLNLFYFNHEHPDELKEIKHEADKLKAQLLHLNAQIKEQIHG